MASDPGAWSGRQRMQHDGRVRTVGDRDDTSTRVAAVFHPRLVRRARIDWIAADHRIRLQHQRAVRGADSDTGPSPRRFRLGHWATDRVGHERRTTAWPGLVPRQQTADRRCLSRQRVELRVPSATIERKRRQRRLVSRVLSKPLPASDGHFSRAPVTRRLQRPNPRARAGDPIALLFGLAPGGVCQAGAVTRAAGELLPHRFTLTALASGGLLSVALVRGVSPPGRYPAPCPAEPGLSSRRVTATGDRPAFSGALQVYARREVGAPW